MLLGQNCSEVLVQLFLQALMDVLTEEGVELHLGQEVEVVSADKWPGTERAEPFFRPQTCVWLLI